MVPLRAVTTMADTWNPLNSQNESPFRYVDIGSIDSSEKRIVRAPSVMPSAAPSRARQLVQAGDVLVSTVRPNLNAVAIVPAELDGATASTGFCVLRPSPEILHGPYLFHWVRSAQFVQSMASRATGASYPAVSDAIVRESSMPLPPLTTQRRIAAILDIADSIERHQAARQRALNTLLVSCFLATFGNPLEDRARWVRRRLGDVAEVERGRFSPRPRNDPRYYGGAYPFIQTGDIARAEGLVSHWSQTLNEQGIAVSRGFPKGAIAMAIAANIGDTAIVDFPFYCPDSVVGIVVNPVQLTADYLQMCLRFFKPLLQARAPRTAQRNINLATIRPLQIPVPPLSLQTRFSAIRSKAAQLDRRHAAASRRAESLRRSLSSDVFN